MIAAELTEMVWRKSSRSGTNANRVEVAETPAALAMRDSKNPDGPVLLFPRASWTTFLTGLHAGEFDR